MTNAAATTETIQIYRVYIKATPEAIWDAITSPSGPSKYGYAPLLEYDLRSGRRVPGARQ